MINITVFASGNGSNFQALVDAGKEKQLGNSVITLLITDNETAFVRERARKEKIKELFIDPRKFPSKDVYEEELMSVLDKERVQLIALAGYMRLLGTKFVRKYNHAILNIHPSLLPAYKGTHSIERAFNAKEKETGVTVHFVDEKVDHGPVILQEKVVIEPTDTVQSLEEKVHRLEHKLYPRAVRLFVDGRLKVGEDSRVRIL